MPTRRQEYFSGREGEANFFEPSTQKDQYFCFGYVISAQWIEVEGGPIVEVYMCPVFVGTIRFVYVACCTEVEVVGQARFGESLLVIV